MNTFFGEDYGKRRNKQAKTMSRSSRIGLVFLGITCLGGGVYALGSFTFSPGKPLNNPPVSPEEAACQEKARKISPALSEATGIDIVKHALRQCHRSPTKTDKGLQLYLNQKTTPAITGNLP